MYDFFFLQMWGVLLAAILIACAVLSCLQNAYDAIRLEPSVSHINHFLKHIQVGRDAYSVVKEIILNKI